MTHYTPVHAFYYGRLFLWGYDAITYPPLWNPDVVLVLRICDGGSNLILFRWMNHLLSLIALIPCKNVFSTLGEELNLRDELDDMVFPISSFFILHLNFFIPWETTKFSSENSWDQAQDWSSGRIYWTYYSSYHSPHQISSLTFRVACRVQNLL